MEDSAYVTMNGVRRFVSTCDSPSLYHYAFEHENITVSKHTIEREVRRVGLAAVEQEFLSATGGELEHQLALIGNGSLG